MDARSCDHPALNHVLSPAAKLGLSHEDFPVTKCAGGQCFHGFQPIAKLQQAAGLGAHLERSTRFAPGQKAPMRAVAATGANQTKPEAMR